VYGKYNTDKPDLRPDKNDPDLLAFMWLIDPPMFKYSETERKLGCQPSSFYDANREDMEKYPDEPKKWRRLRL